MRRGAILIGAVKDCILFDTHCRVFSHPNQIDVRKKALHSFESVVITNRLHIATVRNGLSTILLTSCVGRMNFIKSHI